MPEMFPYSTDNIIRHNIKYQFIAQNHLKVNENDIKSQIQDLLDGF